MYSERVIREITTDLDIAQYLREYSIGNKFDYEVERMVEAGLEKNDAIEAVIRRAYRERVIVHG